MATAQQCGFPDQTIQRKPQLHFEQDQRVQERAQVMSVSEPGPRELSTGFKRRGGCATVFSHSSRLALEHRHGRVEHWLCMFFCAGGHWGSAVLRYMLLARSAAGIRCTQSLLSILSPEGVLCQREYAAAATATAEDLASARGEGAGAVVLTQVQVLHHTSALSCCLQCSITRDDPCCVALNASMRHARHSMPAPVHTRCERVQVAFR